MYLKQIILLYFVLIKLNSGQILSDEFIDEINEKATTWKVINLIENLH